ncbi:MAG: penicillin-binding protein activator [Candidatus Marinimicrobia bacterium]|nr:penicillin-binding protein activator [Candidatus Neomarinimicrobiota bacterium]
MNKYIKLLLLQALVVSSLFGQFGIFTNRSGQERFDRGVESFNEGHYANAAGIFRKLVRSGYPELITAATMMLMKAEYHSGNPEAARETGRRFINQFPDSRYLTDIHFCYGDIFITEGQPNEALRMYLTARRLSEQPATQDLIDSRLLRLIGLGIPVDYIQNLLITEANLSNRAILHLTLSFSHLMAGHPDQAAEVLHRIGRDELPQLHNDLFRTILRQTYQPGQQVLSVAVILPLSGSEAGLGKTYLKGLKQAIDDLNKAGVRVALSIYDNNSDAVESVLAVRQCALNQNIKLILGPLTTNNSIAAATVAQGAEIPIIIPLCSQDNLSMIGDFVFQMNATLTTRGKLAARYLAQELDLDSLALIAPNDDFGHSLADAFLAEVDMLGKTVVAVEWYPGIPENLRRQFMALRKTAFGLQESDEYDEYLGMEIDSLDAMFEIPEDIFFEIPESDDKPLTRSDSAKIVLETIQGIFIPIHPGHIQFLGTQFPAYNLKTQLIGNENWLDLEILSQEIIGPHLNGMLFVSNYLTPADSSTVVELRADEDSDIRYYYQGFDGGLLLSNLAQAGLNSRVGTKTELENLYQFVGLTQIVTFAGENNNVNSALRVLKYNNQEIIDIGFFNGDSIIVSNPAIP